MNNHAHTAQFTLWKQHSSKLRGEAYLEKIRFSICLCKVATQVEEGWWEHLLVLIQLNPGLQLGFFDSKVTGGGVIMISLLRLLYKAETIKKSNLTFNGILEGMGTASAGWRHPPVARVFRETFYAFDFSTLLWKFNRLTSKSPKSCHVIISRQGVNEVWQFSRNSDHI